MNCTQLSERMCNNMTNKEKLNKAISHDYSKEENYNKIIKKIEGEKMNINNIWKRLIVPVCLIVVICGIVFLNSQDKNITLENYNDKENNVKLNINNLANIGATRLDADVKEVSTNDINILWPEFIKEGITVPKYLNKSSATAIYTRKDRDSEYDILNCYVYDYSNENNEDYKNIRIAFSDTNKPIRDYHFSDEKAQSTIIKDVKLIIFKYNTTYFTEFNYKGYNFDIETNNISEQELSNLLVSIIK